MDRPEAMPLHVQVDYLHAALNANLAAQSVLAAASDLRLRNWYLGAGGVAQTVWNLRHGFRAAEGIKDYDLVYFDSDDLSAQSEARMEQLVAGQLTDLEVVVDVKNQARVHLWYHQRFGRPIEPYASTEDAIANWPTTASSVGVRPEGQALVVCAPFGLSDLLGMVARPNKTLITRDVYEKKVARWTARWPKLQMIPW